MNKRRPSWLPQRQVDLVTIEARKGRAGASAYATQEVLFLDIKEHIRYFRDEFLDALQPDEPGIYARDHIRPLVTVGQSMYVASKSGAPKEIKSLEGVKSDVVDINGSVLIPAYMVINAEKMLSETPFISPRLVEIMELVIRATLDSMTPYVQQSRDYEALIEQQLTERARATQVRAFKDSPRYTEALSYLEDSTQRMVSAIAGFVGEDVWRIYGVLRRGESFIIERGTDYRIQDWTNRMMSGNWSWHT